MTSVYQLPRLFYRIKSQQIQFAKHFIALREKKQYRLDQGSVIVQGYKTVKELRDQGIQFKSMVVTAKKELSSQQDILSPSLHVIQHPEHFPAKEYYAADINLARRILGTASKPGNHDIFAEAIIPKYEKDDARIYNQDRILVLDKIADPGNMGTLLRTAKALGWHSGLVTHHSCDLYNDKCIRASRGLSLTWPHATVNKHDLLKHLRQHGFTPIVADMLPSKSKQVDLWSPENQSEPGPGTGVWFWNQPKPSVPIKKMALILCSEHHGVDESFPNELRVSLPMTSSVESLNVATAGGIIMSDLNRAYKQVQDTI